MAQEAREKFNKALIKTLKSERKKLGISHEKLAMESKVSRQAIGKIEAGERSPTLFTVYKLAKALDLSLEEFIRKMELD